MKHGHGRGPQTQFIAFGDPNSVMAALGGAVAFLAVATAGAEEVRLNLTTGDVLIGRLIDETSTMIVLEHPVFGRLEVPRDQLAAPPEAPPAEEPPAPPEPEPARLLPGWESQLDVGVAGSEGNAQSFDARVAFLTLNETDTDRWKIDAGYYYGTSGGETTKHSLTAGILKDWLMPDSPWLLFAQGRYDFDQFRSWKHRAGGHGGAGYEFIKTEELTLIGRIGAGAVREWKPADGPRPEGLLGGEVIWRIDDRQRLTAHTTLYPDLGDFFEFRLVSGAAWTMTLDVASGLGLSVGVDNEYESSTAPGVRNNDLKYFAGLTLSF